MTRVVINIAMTIEAPDQAGLAALYRSGLAQLAIALSTSKREGRLHINGDMDYGSRRLLNGVFSIDNHTPPEPAPTTTTHEREF